MKRKWSLVIGLASVLLVTVCAMARAQYRPASRHEPEKASEDSFREAVDLNRFRTGNENWDTQALVASGLTALHEENLRILRELEALKSEIKQLKENRE